MASSLSSPHFFMQQPHQSDLYSSCKSNKRTIFHSFGPKTWKVKNRKEQEQRGLLRSNNVVVLVCSSVASNHVISESVHIVGKSNKVKYNQIDYLVQVLHKSARSFSVAIRHRESAKRSPELAKAWVGVDVHAWHKHIAYQVAVYALLKTALDARLFLSDEQRNELSPLHDIISPKLSMLLEFIENQLSSKDQNLTRWFKMVKLPLLSGRYIPLFKRWSAEHDGSGVAVSFLAISCCVAVRKLGDGRISSPKFTQSIPNIIGELMDSYYGIIPVDKLHSLASAAGVEQEFLSHFGAKVLPNQESEEGMFWLGLVQKKLSIAFQRESVVSQVQACTNNQDLVRNLATLGLFAFLGRRTRLFLTRMGIKDHDEQLKDFISYLECGSLFMYPEFSSLPVYQLFMEVVAEEIGWLDLYAAVPGIRHHERKRSKQHALQAEKEIILSAVFSVCSDVFSRFAHFSNSNQQSLDANLKEFLNRSCNLLSICLEDHWAAYFRSCELLKYEEILPRQKVPFVGSQGMSNVSALNGVQRKDIMALGVHFTSRLESKSSSPDETDTITILKSPSISETKRGHRGMLKNYGDKLISTTFDIFLGTRLLFIDISAAMGLFLKQLRGHMLTKREMKKMEKTLADFASVIPVTILMLLPVSAIGHAAMLAGIKKYIPFLIPSSYSSERLDIVKQLNRTKKMEVKSLSNLSDVSSLH